MPTLLLRLSAPMQAWGTQSNFTHRDTGREPSKSGIIGILCAALGVSRSVAFIEEPYSDLVNLRMGVRIDCEGKVRRDFHTAGMGGIYKVSGGIKKSLIVSDRYYLADATFLVGLEGELSLLQELQAALQRPKWLLFLGRKAFIPAERIWLPDGIQSYDLLETLTTYPWLGRMSQPPQQLRCVIEDPNGSVTRHDHVVSFDTRRFIPRRMRVQFIPTPQTEKDEQE